jgi:hypothetical protein
MVDLPKVIHLLKAALDEPSRLPEVIAAVQRLVWKGAATDTLAIERLRDLALDLDFFEADPIKRKEDSSLFGEGRALQEIQETISFLEREGSSAVQVTNGNWRQGGNPDIRHSLLAVQQFYAEGTKAANASAIRDE